MPLSPLVSHGKRVVSDILGATVDAGPGSLYGQIPETREVPIVALLSVEDRVKAMNDGDCEDTRVRSHLLEDQIFAPMSD